MRAPFCSLHCSAQLIMCTPVQLDLADKALLGPFKGDVGCSFSLDSQHLMMPSSLDFPAAHELYYLHTICCGSDSSNCGSSSNRLGRLVVTAIGPWRDQESFMDVSGSIAISCPTGFSLHDPQGRRLRNIDIALPAGLTSAPLLAYAAQQRRLAALYRGSAQGHPAHLLVLDTGSWQQVGLLQPVQLSLSPDRVAKGMVYTSFSMCLSGCWLVGSAGGPTEPYNAACAMLSVEPGAGEGYVAEVAGVQAAPVVSVDGKWLAFARSQEGCVVVQRAGSEPATLPYRWPAQCPRASRSEEAAAAMPAQFGEVLQAEYAWSSYGMRLAVGFGPAHCLLVSSYDTACESLEDGLPGMDKLYVFGF